VVELVLSPLEKTWFIDLDGTVLIHNSDVAKNEDQVILKSLDFLKTIEDDHIIFTTSRSRKHKKKTENFLRLKNIKFDFIIYDLPYGERILVNDNKSSGLTTAYAIALERNAGINLSLFIDQSK
jgi:hypothetical protein